MSDAASGSIQPRVVQDVLRALDRHGWHAGLEPSRRRWRCGARHSRPLVAEPPARPYIIEGLGRDGKE